MATQIVSRELEGMGAFCAALAHATGNPATLERLCAAGHYRALSQGGELRPDGEADHLVFVAKGAAKLLTRSACNQRKPNLAINNAQPSTHILAFHFADDIVFIPKSDADEFRLTALGDLELVVFCSDELMEAVKGDAAIIRMFVARLTQALGRSRARIIALGHKSARQRVAGFLVTMAERVCGCTKGSCEFALPMSRTDIGDSLGLTIETVSRQFADLRKDCLIETLGRRGLRVSAIESLVQEARCQ